MKHVFSAFVLIFFLIIVCLNVPAAAAEAPKAPASSPTVNLPQVAELDRLKMQNTALEYQLLLTQFENSDTVSALKTKLRTLVAEVLQKAGNPTDYQLDPVTWTFVKKTPTPSPPAR